jgi:hypothetical protein
MVISSVVIHFWVMFLPSKMSGLTPRHIMGIDAHEVTKAMGHQDLRDIGLLALPS